MQTLWGWICSSVIPSFFAEKVEFNYTLHKFNRQGGETMNSNKKPGEPLETEGRVMEDEIQKLKRSSLILSVACFVQSLLLLRIVWQISDIYSTLEILLGNFESVYGSILSLRSGLIPILETVKNLLL